MPVPLIHFTIMPVPGDQQLKESPLAKIKTNTTTELNPSICMSITALLQQQAQYLGLH
jgi:hypothetical protein